MAKHLAGRAYLLIGGNMGDRAANLFTAREHIAACGTISAVSQVYRTAAWGLGGQPDFLNQALQLDTLLAAPQLLAKLLHIEKIMGRVRKEKNGPRIIDIDIILYGAQIIDEPQLSIPHPQMANRRFVLVPLAEIAPQAMHPLFHKTIAQLLHECTDKLAVVKWKAGQKK